MPVQAGQVVRHTSNLCTTQKRCGFTFSETAETTKYKPTLPPHPFSETEVPGSSLSATSEPNTCPAPTMSQHRQTHVVPTTASMSTPQPEETADYLPLNFLQSHFATFCVLVLSLKCHLCAQVLIHLLQPPYCPNAEPNISKWLLTGASKTDRNGYQLFLDQHHLIKELHRHNSGHLPLLSTFSPNPSANPTACTFRTPPPILQELSPCLPEVHVP